MDQSTAASCADILQVTTNGIANARWNSDYFTVKYRYVNDPNLVLC